MLKLAWRNLTYDKTRLAISAGGVALAILLILVIGGIFAGSEEHAVLYIRKQPASLWLMQSGVENLHMSSSILPDTTLEQVRRIPGVREAAGVLYGGGNVEIGDTTVYSYVFGIEPDAPLGGPWELAAGSDDPAFNEIILDTVLAERYGIGLGDTVRVMGYDLVITGLSRDTLGIATSIVFVNKQVLSAVMGVPSQTSSYILIQLEPEADLDSVREDIRATVPEANLLTQKAFAESDQQLIRQMGADIIQLMNTLAYLIGLVVIGIATYTTTLDWAREYGVLKALGADRGQLLSVVFVQAFVTGGLGFGVGILVAYGTAALINGLYPEMLVLIQPDHWLGILPTLVLVTGIAAFLPVGRIMRLDPMVVFKT
jgi:putative ABC transport system permease protein